MASDTDPAYPVSPLAHARLGYEATSIRFRKSLPEEATGHRGIEPGP